MSELLPCPFCGSEIKHIESVAKSFDPPRLYHEWHHPAIDCPLNHGHSGSFIIATMTDDAAAQKRAVDRWNMRPPQSPAVAPAAPEPAREWHHKKSGHVVTEIGRGRVQAATPIEEMQHVVIYEHDGNMWVRSVTEFEDGRFEPVAKSSDDCVVVVEQRTSSLPETGCNPGAERWFKGDVCEDPCAGAHPVTRGGHGFESHTTMLPPHDAAPPVRSTAMCASPPADTVREAFSVEEIAKWLHNETDHPEHCPDHTWPENEFDDGRRASGFVKIVPKYAQEYFRDIARRLVAGPLAALSIPAPIEAGWRDTLQKIHYALTKDSLCDAEKVASARTIVSAAISRNERGVEAS